MMCKPMERSAAYDGLPLVNNLCRSGKQVDESGAWVRSWRPTLLV